MQKQSDRVSYGYEGEQILATGDSGGKGFKKPCVYMS